MRTPVCDYWLNRLKLRRFRRAFEDGYIGLLQAGWDLVRHDLRWRIAIQFIEEEMDGRMVQVLSSRFAFSSKCVVIECQAERSVLRRGISSEADQMSSTAARPITPHPKRSWRQLVAQAASVHQMPLRLQERASHEMCSFAKLSKKPA